MLFILFDDNPVQCFSHSCHWCRQLTIRSATFRIVLSQSTLFLHTTTTITKKTTNEWESIHKTIVILIKLSALSWSSLLFSIYRVNFVRWIKHVTACQNCPMISIKKKSVGELSKFGLVWRLHSERFGWSPRLHSIPEQSSCFICLYSKCGTFSHSVEERYMCPGTSFMSAFAPSHLLWLVTLSLNLSARLDFFFQIYMWSTDFWSRVSSKCIVSA